jgi:hypothetical protein
MAEILSACTPKKGIMEAGVIRYIKIGHLFSPKLVITNIAKKEKKLENEKIKF